MGVLGAKVTLVVGASRGVGVAIARSLAEEGAAVIVNYLKSERCAEEVARDIRKRGVNPSPTAPASPTRRRWARWSVRRQTLLAPWMYW
jgi:NAD(P)-dependent dehydrogenase (short-subunit alcohol dehydrogenase family)